MGCVTRLRSEGSCLESDVLVQGRFSNIGAPSALITVDIVRMENGKVAEHWDVWQDEATKASSKSGLPMFGDRFPGRFIESAHWAMA